MHNREDDSEKNSRDGFVLDDTATSPPPTNDLQNTSHLTTNPPNSRISTPFRPSINQTVAVGVGSTSSSVTTTTSIPFSSATASTSQSVSQHPSVTGSSFGHTSDYATYVSLMRDLSDLSSDDEDFNLALTASLETEQ